MSKDQRREREREEDVERVICNTMSAKRKTEKEYLEKLKLGSYMTFNENFETWSFFDEKKTV